jgi:hypothetical protein
MFKTLFKSIEAEQNEGGNLFYENVEKEGKNYKNTLILKRKFTFPL